MWFTLLSTDALHDASPMLLRSKDVSSLYRTATDGAPCNPLAVSHTWRSKANAGVSVSVVLTPRPCRSLTSRVSTACWPELCILQQHA